MSSPVHNRDQELHQLKRKAVGKLAGRVAGYYTSRYGNKDLRGVASYAGQHGAQLLYDHYGDQIEREAIRIFHKVIDSTRLTFHPDHEDHIDDSAAALADQIWAANAPRR